MKQTNLFGEIEILYLSIDDAANEIGVSTATIRNWIKTGYLESSARGMITRDSLTQFVSEVSGKEKLNTRANKLQKDSHNHKEITEKLAYKIVSESKHSDSLGQDYESSLSESHRNKEGIYYTPQSVIDDMLSVSAE